MRNRARLIALALVSLILSCLGSFFTPGAFLHRLLAIALCSLFSFPSNACLAQWPRASQRAVAAVSMPPAEKTTDNSLLAEKQCYFGVCTNLPDLPDPAKRLIYEKIGESLGVKAAIHLDAKKQVFKKAEALQNFQPVMLKPSSLKDLAEPLKPGDYAVRLMSFCTQWSVHVPGSGTPYRLGRADGSRVKMITSFLIRGQSAGLSPDQLQNVNWLLQSGLPVSQWNEENRKLAQKYLPEYQNELKGDILDQMRGEYQNWVSKSPVQLPDFDGILSKIPTGKQIIALKQGRDLLTNRAISAQEVGSRLYDATAEQDGRPQKLPAYEGKDQSPWVEMMPGVIGRYQLQNARAGDGSDGLNLLEFRVLSSSSQAKSLGETDKTQVAYAVSAAPTLLRIVYGAGAVIGGPEVAGAVVVAAGGALIIYGVAKGVQALINIVAMSPKGKPDVLPVPVPTTRDDTTSKKCLPCKPVPVGGLAYQYHSEAAGEKPHNGMPNHTHHLKMNQSPPMSGCKCFWKRDFIKVTPNFSPLPGAIPVEDATGGGIAP